MAFIAAHGAQASLAYLQLPPASQALTGMVGEHDAVMDANTTGIAVEGAVAAHLARMHAQRAAWPVVSRWPVLLPGARRRLERPYPTAIDDVSERPNLPCWAGFVWSPRRTLSLPSALADVAAALASEHDGGTVLRRKARGAARPRERPCGIR